MRRPTGKPAQGHLAASPGDLGGRKPLSRVREEEERRRVLTGLCSFQPY